MHSEKDCGICVITRCVVDSKGSETTIANKILFGKYEVLSVLGSGSFATVYLSRHLKLECYRALKLIPKTSFNSRDSLIFEALLLKSLKHSAIPHVYDLEEDTDYYGIIEEFVEGETLEVFLSHQSTISLEYFFEICLQLCDVFSYLHTQTPTPVLYLDLKPEHIIVCGTQIKLIDFNVATFLSNTGNILNLFGNRDYSAPELFEGTPPNPSCDIYSIGKIMEYLSGFVDVPIPPRLQQIIYKAAQKNPNCRFETVDSLISALEEQQLSYQQPHLCKKIAIYGCHSGCGVTHIAISLVSNLNYLGFPSTYYDRSRDNDFQFVPTYSRTFTETNGMITHRFFKGYPNYGPGICLPQTTDTIQIYDYGTSIPLEPEDADIVLLICSNNIWKWQYVFAQGESLLKLYGSLKFVCNLGQKKNMRIFAKHFHSPINEFPFLADPFCITTATISFTRRLLNMKRRKHLFFHFQNGLFEKP